jgi:hypothetical protein
MNCHHMTVEDVTIAHGVEVSRCTWGCGQVLVAIPNEKGIVPKDFTVAEIWQLQTENETAQKTIDELAALCKTLTQELNEALGGLPRGGKVMVGGGG